MFQPTTAIGRRLVDAVRKLAAENPDFMYTRQDASNPTPDEVFAACNYYPTEGNPQGCIIGAAMRSLGHDLDAPAWRCIAAYEALGDTFGEAIDHGTQAWATAVQANQDAGMTWSQAVRAADAR